MPGAPIIEGNWQITFNKSNCSGWVDQLKGMHSYSFILYNNRVLAWDFPERVPEYVKNRVYRELTRKTHAKTGKQWTPQQLQAHRALIRASEKMGWNNYQAGLAAHVRKGRKANTYRYHPTEEHERVTKASSDVLKGKITPEQAMAMLHEYDIFNQRMGQAKKGRSHAKIRPDPLATRRTFNNVQLYAWGYTSLSHAKREVEVLRSMGHPTRLVKVKNGYQVFTSAEGLQVRVD